MEIVFLSLEEEEMTFVKPPSMKVSLESFFFFAERGVARKNHQSFFERKKSYFFVGPLWHILDCSRGVIKKTHEANE